MIRPSPDRRMAVNASRQHRNEPVRFTSSVSPHTSAVISANGTDFKTPAAHTTAAGLPIPSTSAKRRSTSPALLTSVGAGVASPPLSRMRAAISSRPSRSRAASTTCAPAAAMASAVAAPIPRLAPVTTVKRPESQCLDSTIDRGPGTGADDSPVQPFVTLETPPEIQVALGVRAAFRTRQSCRPPDGVGCGVDVVGRDEEAGQLVDDDLTECAAIEGDDGCPARLGLGGDHAERLVPLRRAENDGRARHRLPERRSRHGWMDADARLGPLWIDPGAHIFGVVAVPVDIDTDPCRPGDVDGFRCPLFRAQPAGENRPIPRPR